MKLELAYPRFVQRQADAIAFLGMPLKWETLSDYEVIYFPCDVRSDFAKRWRGQPKGWRRGVVLIRMIRDCAGEWFGCSDLDSVKAVYVHEQRR